jgi:PKD repeat protein
MRWVGIQRMANRLRANRNWVLVALLVSTFGFPASATAAGSSWWWFFGDDLAPVFYSVTPSAGAEVANSYVIVEFDVYDPWRFGLRTSRLDGGSIQVSLNGQPYDNVEFERKGLSQWFPWILPIKGTIQVKTAQSWEDGPQHFIVSIADKSGNRGSAEHSFLVDTKGPTFTRVAPAPGNPIKDSTAALQIRAADDGVGVDWKTLSVNASPSSAVITGYDTESGVIDIVPESEWYEVELAIALSLSDSLANESSQTLVYDVQPEVGLSATIDAEPLSGSSPLTVSFSPEIETNTAIEVYRWDFNNDGVFDRSEPIGRDQSYTFDAPGSYPVTLQVLDSAGETVDAMVTIEVDNAPPEITAEAQPSNGTPPLVVSFSATASDDNGIESYEWDYNGDGVYDENTSTGSTTFTYASEGQFQPRIRVTDTLGAAADLAIPSISIRVITGAPTVSGTASPTSGKAPLTVQYNATASDPDGLPITAWAWDFDGDGTDDYTSVDSGSVSHTIPTPGTFYSRVTATAEDGGTGEDFVKVTVLPSFALSLSRDTIDTELAENVQVQTNLGGDTDVSVVIQDSAGGTVTTLVSWQVRLAGDYTDAWDGRNTAGEFVSEGDYRAVMFYRIDGVEKRFNTVLSSGGREYNPPRNRLPSQFSPFDGDPLDITFTLSEASEVTAFIGRYNVNTRLVTFYQRKPLGRGSHTITWHGENNNGELIHPPGNDRFLFGIFAFSLPDNAVYVKSGVHVSAISAAPPIVDPTRSGDEDNQGTSTISFLLSRGGAAEMTVYDADTGAFVAQKMVSGLSQGENTLTWNGKDNNGTYVSPGTYRIGILGLDERGSRTMEVFTLQRVYY